MRLSSKARGSLRLGEPCRSVDLWRRRSRHWFAMMSRINVQRWPRVPTLRRDSISEEDSCLGVRLFTITEKTFIDTNILSYAYDVDADDKHKSAKNALIVIWDERVAPISNNELQH